MRRTHSSQVTAPLSARQFSAATFPPLPQLQPAKLPSGKIAPPRLVILGPPAGGKGTQCELLVELLGVVHLSTGNILRQAIQDRTPLGLKAQQYMDHGELVPDDLIVDVVLGRLAESDCMTRGWLLDGFPRTARQAEALLKAQGGMAAPDCVLELEVPDKEVIRRIAGRRVDPVTGKTYHVEFHPPPADVVNRVVQRSDDTEEKIHTRLTQFHTHADAVRSVFETYRGEFGATIQVMRASGYQAPPAIAKSFADFALERAAQRSLALIRRDISKRLRRRLETGGRGPHHIPNSQQKPSYPVRARVRALYAPLPTRLAPESEQRLKPVRGMLRELLRRLRTAYAAWQTDNVPDEKQDRSKEAPAALPFAVPVVASCSPSNSGGCSELEAGAMQ
ncbi:putative adenylate kinase [Phytophthora cinnamomi]|uniref:putative adenylate kinase n=1 Tax=Phytophthora cinnamomi TaxID=4785 RepID=UPI003559F6CA|nr:putative adenylate kinase [Phytophthora cinnamomi]